MTHTDNAREYRRKIERVAQHAPDAVALAEPSLFPAWVEDDAVYATGYVVRYDNLLYRCLQSHTSQPTWKPGDAPSLWVRIDDPAEQWPEWRQPEGAHNAYLAGAQVSHAGEKWVNGLDNNTYEPGVYGWEQAE